MNRCLRNALASLLLLVTPASAQEQPLTTKCESTPAHQLADELHLPALALEIGDALGLRDGEEVSEIIPIE